MADVETGVDGFELPADEVRVLGCLIEKQLTTPQHYPLTLNALVLACNQSSARDPVVSYDEPTTESAVRSLKQKGLTRFVHPSHGRSVRRYEHLLGDVLGVDQAQLAILAVLMLRGPQTVGEIRNRTDRMVDFDDLGQVAHDLDLLASHAAPLVSRLSRRPGQKEERFVHLLGVGDPGIDPGPVATAGPPHGDGEPGPGWQALVASLQRDVLALRHDLEEVRTGLGLGPTGEG